MTERHKWVRVWRGGSIYIHGHGDGFSVTPDELLELLEDAKEVLEGRAEVQIQGDWRNGVFTPLKFELLCAYCSEPLPPTEQTRFCNPGCKEGYMRYVT